MAEIDPPGQRTPRGVMRGVQGREALFIYDVVGSLGVTVSFSNSVATMAFSRMTAA
jgi:hypothetical protein